MGEKPERILREAIEDIRRKVHAHNRGGELKRGLRDEVRNICDGALSAYRSALAEGKEKS